MLLEALRLPKEVAVVHVKAHGKAADECQRRGNAKADVAAKEAAQMGGEAVFQGSAHEVPFYLEDCKAKYGPGSDKLAAELKAIKNPQGWWIVPGGKVLIPRCLLGEIPHRLHYTTHMGGNATGNLLTHQMVAPGLYLEAQRVVSQCPTCQKVNPKSTRPPAPMGGRPWAHYPGQAWQIDFAELPKSGRYRYLLVLVDQLTGWVEAYPTRTATASTVTRVLLHEIIPRFLLPESVESDQGSHFVGKIVQEVSKALDITWKLHAPWRPQSSGQVERMNRTLKAMLMKICIETHLKWPQALPLALTRIRSTPRRGIKLSPFELMFGMPPRVLPAGWREQVTVDLGKSEIWEHVIALQSVLSSLHRFAAPFQSLPLDAPIHNFKPGDQVLVQKWRKNPLAERWEGPYQVLLTTHTAVRLSNSDKWTHCSRVKPFHPEDTNSKVVVTPEADNTREQEATNGKVNLLEI
ncbi:protein NYNRIN-like [Alligator mississippiensis]|uniref:protein NYNRIN-like n=1 Tax=Alligator mississippiensis TaxID=8496 RepID=UPI002877C577|nr:protein NYNRIN-like [Alligator mississippiensis]